MNYIWARPCENVSYAICEQQSLISVFVVRCLDSIIPLRTQAFSMRTTKTLIRLGGCPGWSESSLGAHAILLVLTWGGSFPIFRHMIRTWRKAILMSFFLKRIENNIIWLSANNHLVYFTECFMELIGKHTNMVPKPVEGSDKFVFLSRSYFLVVRIRNHNFLCKFLCLCECLLFFSCTLRVDFFQD